MPTGFGTIRGCRHPLGALECIPHRQGGATVFPSVRKILARPQDKQGQHQARLSGLRSRAEPEAARSERGGAVSHVPCKCFGSETSPPSTQPGEARGNAPSDGFRLAAKRAMAF